MQLRRAGNRDDPRLLREHPRERDLRRRRALALGDRAHELDERLVRASRVRIGEARDRVTEVAALELRVLRDRAGEEALAEWAERDEADAELLERGEDLLLRLAPPERVLTLQRRHGLDGMRAADVLHARLRHPEVPHLAGLDQLLDGAGDVFDRDVRIDAVLVEQVDPVGAEP